MLLCTTVIRVTWWYWFAWNWKATSRVT